MTSFNMVSEIEIPHQFQNFYATFLASASFRYKIVVGHSGTSGNKVGIAVCFPREADILSIQ